MSVSYQDAEILARTIYGEARNQGMSGMVAVAAVMINRWRSKKWFAGKTIAETCQKPYQFSCWLKSDPNLPKLLAVTRDDAVFRNCWDAGLTALAGPLPFGSNVYHYKTKAVHPEWAEGETPVLVLGDHEFYANIN